MSEGAPTQRAIEPRSCVQDSRNAREDGGSERGFELRVQTDDARTRFAPAQMLKEGVVGSLPGVQCEMARRAHAPVVAILSWHVTEASGRELGRSEREQFAEGKGCGVGGLPRRSLARFGRGLVEC
eukprot:2640634-Rhodomonas_salina.2